MTAVKPLVLYTDSGLSQIRSGDTLILSSLGTGTPSASTFLRGDGTWAQVVTSITVTPTDGITATVTPSSGSQDIALGLANITPLSITTGVITSTVNLSTSAVTITQTGSGNALDVVGKVSFSGSASVSGGMTLNNFATLYSSAASVLTTSTTVIDSFSAILYRSAKYQVQIADGTNFETLEVYVIHDGATVFLTSYGNVFTSQNSLGFFDATLSANTISLTYTASQATNKTIKFIRSTITV